MRGQVLSMEGGTYGGFPIKFLVLVVSSRLSKGCSDLILLASLFSLAQNSVHVFLKSIHIDMLLVTSPQGTVIHTNGALKQCL
jgi:hypothetical protein